MIGALLFTKGRGTEMSNEPELRPKQRIGLLGAAVAIMGTLSAFLAGVNWNVLLSPEGAAVAGATVGVMGSLVVLVRAVTSYMEKKRNG